MVALETPQRIEPARIEEASPILSDVVADLSAASATLGQTLHPKTAANLADLVRVMNTYYSNLIEGHNTRPKGHSARARRQLRRTTAHGAISRSKRLRMCAFKPKSTGFPPATNNLPEPASTDFIRWLHREFYKGAPQRNAADQGRQTRIRPWCPANGVPPPETGKQQSVDMCRHRATRVADFMAHFEQRYRFENTGKASRIMALAAAHHRFNYIHPFPDGNGRVSRLMSHAMSHYAGIGAHGLWSISRGLARGLSRGPSGRSEYKTMMDASRHATARRP